MPNTQNQNNKVKPIPEGYYTVTPYIVVKDATKALDFYSKAFGAKEVYRFEQNGKIMHAEIQIGDSRIMLSDEMPDMGGRAPTGSEKFPIGLMLYVENVDQFAERAQGAGAKMREPVKDQFYGDRCGSLQDPFGHTWVVATHIEDVSKDELKRRAEKLFSKKDVA